MKEKLKNVFEKEYTEDKLTDFLIKTQKVYELFGYDFKLNQKTIVQEQLCSATVWLNDDYINSTISNLDIIEFELLYPKLIIKLLNTNLENFNEVFSKLLDYYHEDISIEKYINSVYGHLGNPLSLIYSDNIPIVSIHANNIMRKIINEFKGHVIYVDTFQIFFRNFSEIKERFESVFNQLNKYDLTYSTTQSKFGLFIAKKQYLIEENNGIKIKGMQHFKKDGMDRGGFIELLNSK